jgi:hypothetical protein
MLETTSKQREKSEKKSESVGDAAAASTSAGPARREEADVAAPTAAPKRQQTESRIDRIARRAHEIYLARGGAHGKALEDWLQAEREIDAEMEEP